MLHSLTSQISTAIYVCAVAFGLWKGGLAECWAALVIGVAAAVFLLGFDYKHYWDPQMRILAIDSAEFAGLLAVTVKYRSRWLVAASGTQLLCALLRVVPILDPRIRERAWLTLEYLFGYIVLVCLVVGTIQAMRRRAQVRAQADAAS